jgi:hypothetical protein
MNKLLAALVVSVFALGSVAAMADDQTPAQPVDPVKLKAEKDAARAAAAKMTPEEKVLARKAKRAKKQQEYSGSDGAARARTLDRGNDPYGTTPVRTPRGTPLIGDFDRRINPLPPGGPAQRDPAKSNP